MQDALFQAYTLQNQYGIPHSEVWAFVDILYFNITWVAHGLVYAALSPAFCFAAGQATSAVNAARPESNCPACIDYHTWYV